MRLFLLYLLICTFSIETSDDTSNQDAGQLYGANMVQFPSALNTLRGRMNAGEQYGPWPLVGVNALG